MASCEKCWEDAYMESSFSSKSTAECYQELLRDRKNNPCSPEEQAGRDAKICTVCGRKTIHQRAGYCMNLKCSKNKR